MIFFIFLQLVKAFLVIINLNYGLIKYSPDTTVAAERNFGFLWRQSQLS